MKFIDTITRVILFVLFIVALYMIILKLSSHSPTLEAITITIITIVGSALAKLMADFYKFEGKVETHIDVTKNTFTKIGNKLDKLEADINELKSDMKLIKHKLKIYS